MLNVFLRLVIDFGYKLLSDTWQRLASDRWLGLLCNVGVNKGCVANRFPPVDMVAGSMKCWPARLNGLTAVGLIKCATALSHRNVSASFWYQDMKAS